MKLLRLLCLIGSLCCCGLSHAQASRANLIQRIADAQGLSKLFEEQLAQQRDAARSQGQQVFENLVSESGVAPGPQAKDALARFVKRSETLFSSAEYLSVWAAAYAGTGLTDDDLKAILAYYESPLGKKDGQAAQAAMKGFTGWFIEQNQARMSTQLDRLAADLRAVLP